MAQGQLRVGTSGWNYRHWRGLFYPADLPAKRWLGYYAQHFDTVEINATFYRLPSQAAVAAWREAAPPGFIYAWKASQYITHAKKLLDPAEPLARVYAPMAALGGTMGPVLLQLPPQLRFNPDRLAQFLLQLPTGHRHTMEFRDPGWYVDATFELLAKHDVALCLSDHRAAPAPWVRTASFVYIRGHGPAGDYRGAYSDEALATWTAQISAWRALGCDAYAYFDNDIGGAAPFDAHRLRALGTES
jgi:uncharacterized protein YecE (DUF72 family)